MRITLSAALSLGIGTASIMSAHTFRHSAPWVPLAGIFLATLGLLFSSYLNPPRRRLSIVAHDVGGSIDPYLLHGITFEETWNPLRGSRHLRVSRNGIPIGVVLHPNAGFALNHRVMLVDPTGGVLLTGVQEHPWKTVAARAIVEATWTPAALLLGVTRAMEQRFGDRASRTLAFHAPDARDAGVALVTLPPSVGTPATLSIADDLAPQTLVLLVVAAVAHTTALNM
jgi:hypothetical protein